MLQQTQVSRVLEKYKQFLKAFPTAKRLAQAPQAEVLILWSGLGYNRRARFLHQCATELLSYKTFPTEVPVLEKLPGIGHYTARAVATFAFNQPHVFIETNIRTVFVHHFFPKRKVVSDADILKLVERTLDTKNPRHWYSALMDYGSYLKSQGIKVHRQSTLYTKQSTFMGSNRRVRGLIVKALIDSRQSLSSLVLITGCTEKELVPALLGLQKEALIIKQRSLYRLA